jgi:hypothetical protein
LKTSIYFKIIDKIGQLPYLIDIRLGIQGEPFLSKPLMDGLIKLSYMENINSVNTVTNLTIDKETLKSFLEKVNLNKFSLAVSFHHSQIKDIDSFLSNIKLLHEKNILFVVGCVAYPPYLKKIEEYQSFFEKDLNVPFFTNPFSGKWVGKKYPESYKRSERKMIRKLCFSDFEYYNMMKLKTSKGKLCTAGKEFIDIKDDGSIQRCASDSTFIGNILNDQLNLFDVYKPCNVQYCTCPAMSFNLLDFKKKLIETKNFRIYYRDVTGIRLMQKIRCALIYPRNKDGR